MAVKKEVWCTLNGKKTRLFAAGNTTLLQALRDIGVTSVKRGCEEGECGACTVILDGLPQKSCMVLAQEVEGATILTSEGLVQNGTLHPIQQAFIDEGAIQCGFCTTGFLMAAKALLTAEPRPEPDRIRRALGAHLCRCTGYQPIMDAVSLAGEMMERGVTAIPLADLDLATGDISAAATAAEDAPRGKEDSILRFALALGALRTIGPDLTNRGGSSLWRQISSVIRGATPPSAPTSWKIFSPLELGLTRFLPLLSPRR